MYFKYPSQLDEDDSLDVLPIHAKMLYVYLLAMHEQSEKNGWTDERGVYIYYTRENMAKKLKVSITTVKRFFSLLIDAGLVEVGDKGSSLSPRLYVKSLISDESEYQAEKKVVIEKKVDTKEAKTPKKQASPKPMQFTAPPQYSSFDSSTVDDIAMKSFLADVIAYECNNRPL